jgi:hypothetical protein
VVAKNPRTDAFARQRKRHHDDPTAGGLCRGLIGGLRIGRGRLCAGQADATEAGPEVRQRRDLEFDLLMIRERIVVVLFLFSHATHETQRKEGGEEKD